MVEVNYQSSFTGTRKMKTHRRYENHNSGIIKTTITCLIIMAISGLTGWWLKAVQPRPVPTIEWVQEKIGAEVDGVLGPETERLWRRAEFNDYAAEYMTESGKPK